MIAALLRTATLGLLAIALMAASTTLGPGFSSAAFTAETANGANRVGAAADWTPPSVSVQLPAGTLRDVASITALAADAESGIRQVTIAVQAAGGATWTTLCTTTTTTTPYTCSWDTRTFPDGAYDLRAIAIDKAGYSTTSPTVRGTVGNAIGVVLADPGEIVSGTVPLATTLQNAGAGPYSVRVEYAVAGSASWKTLCSNLAAPYSCPWTTTTFTSGESYDLRSSATASGTTTFSNVITDVLVDNTAPSATMTDPGSPLSGTVTLTANAGDAQSGVTRVVIQYASNGTNNWIDACTLTLPPYTCRFGTTTLSNGSYAFRAMATDAAGFMTTSAAVTGRTVDNTIASVAMEDPGAYLTGTPTLTATASSTAGVRNVAIQIAPNGTSSWTTLCTPTASPYSCAWNSKGVADGLYDFRAILTDGTGKQTTSAIVAARRVDNRPVRGTDIQTANGSGTAGRLDAGDSISLTYSTQMAPASISAGWNGAATPVTLRLRDGSALGLNGTSDTLDVLRSNVAVNLGSVNLMGDYIKNNKTSTFTATMTATTATVNGLPVTVVQITVGTLINGGALRTAPATSASNIVWTPSNLAGDLAGTTASNAPVIETGALDREL